MNLRLNTRKKIAFAQLLVFNYRLVSVRLHNLTADVKKGPVMTKVAFSLLVAAGLASSSAMAADMALKAAPAAPPPSPWDIAITGALMSDYNFRGITQSNHQPSTQAGFEPRYNFTPALQGYVGVSGESIDFPNRAAAEIDFYGGIRPTFGKLALDFGIWYYYYPDGQCFNTAAFCGFGTATLFAERQRRQGKPELL